jgi:hypothetical protein
MATTPDPAGIDVAQMTRAQRAALPISADVARALAEQHGVCIRPLAMRRIDTITGRIEVVPVACGSTRQDQCWPCAEKARRLRMAQCRQGWHLDTEPVTGRAAPSEDHTELMAPGPISSLPTPNAKPGVMRSAVSRSPTRSPNSTLNCALPESVAGSPHSIPHPNRSNAPPDAARTPRICLVGRWNDARSGGCSPGATGPRRS